MTKSSNVFTAKRLAIAVAAVCASLSLPAAAADSKALLDLMLKKGVITQAEYDEFARAAADEAETAAFKEKRLSDDVTKLNNQALKAKDAGLVMKNGLGIESADGENSIKLTGRIHMDYRKFGDDAAGDSGYQDKLDIRRARFGFEGKFMKDFDYKIFANFGAPSTQGGMSSTDTELDEGYIGYKYANGLNFRAGKFKMPFSLEQLTSSNNIDFMERSLGGQIEGELIPAKQVGAMVFGAPVDGATYALALSQGSTAARKTSTYSSPDIVGRVSANFSKLLGRQDEVSHVGLAYSTGEIAGIAAGGIESARTEAREASKFFDSTVVVDNGAKRIREGIELAYANGPFKVQAENMKVKYDNVTSADVSYQANYVQVVWNLTGEGHNYSDSSGTFGWIKPKTKFSSKGGLGAWQVGLRYSKFDASDIVPTAGRTDGADAWTAGLTWFANDNMRFMLNYVVTNFDSPVTVNNAGTTGSPVSRQEAIMARAQVSF